MSGGRAEDPLPGNSYISAGPFIGGARDGPQKVTNGGTSHTHTECLTFGRYPAQGRVTQDRPDLYSNTLLIRVPLDKPCRQDLRDVAVRTKLTFYS